MKPHIFHPEAGEEYALATGYYADITLELGIRFHDEIEQLIKRIRCQPERFFRFSPPARRALAHKFPYSVVYLNQPEHIWIIAVMHMKRRPGYWRNRLE